MNDVPQITDVEIYCDESNPDLFSAGSKHSQYLLIGGIKLLSETRKKLKADIMKIRNHYSLFTEFKWNKVSHHKLDFYKSLVDLFFEYGNDVRFRSIVIDCYQVNLQRYHENDAELGFYKFYYQLLNNWFGNNYRYSIFTDLKTNREKNRLLHLKECLNNSHFMSHVSQIQALPSRQVDLLQFADLLLGITNAKMNRQIKYNTAKMELLQYFEDRLGREISPTRKDEIKYNVFKIVLQNRW